MSMKQKQVLSYVLKSSHIISFKNYQKKMVSFSEKPDEKGHIFSRIHNSKHGEFCQQQDRQSSHNLQMQLAN